MNMNDNKYNGVIGGFILGVLAATMLKYLNFLGLFSKVSKKSTSIMNSKYYKMVLVVRTDLNMGKGKIAAQCCHAALGSYKKAEELTPEYLKKWLSQGQPKIVVKLDNQDNETKLYELKRLAQKMNVPCNVVHDAGHTQVKSGTATCAGFGPAPAELIDAITGDLKLL